MKKVEAIIMLKLTTDELIAAIKAISPTFPRFDFENTLEGAERTLYHKLWLEIDRREQRALAMRERAEKIAAIRQRNEERNASIRSQAGQYSAADDMIIGILADLITEDSKVSLKEQTEEMQAELKRRG